LDGSDDGTNPYVYIIQDGTWDGADAAATKKSILEVESTEINKFTIPLTSLEQGSVNISIANLSDAAGNTTNTEVISFTYDISVPDFVSNSSGVMDYNANDYESPAHTNSQRPDISIRFTNNFSIGADEITMYISKGDDFTDDEEKNHLYA
jgi:hypothetical protein